MELSLPMCRVRTLTFFVWVSGSQHQVVCHTLQKGEGERGEEEERKRERAVCAQSLSLSCSLSRASWARADAGTGRTAKRHTGKTRACGLRNLFQTQRSAQCVLAEMGMTGATAQTPARA
jgi:hypothetical protein